LPRHHGFSATVEKSENVLCSSASDKLLQLT